VRWRDRADRRVVNAEAGVSRVGQVRDDDLKREFFEAFRDHAAALGFEGTWNHKTVLRRWEHDVAWGMRVRASDSETELLIESGDRAANEGTFAVLRRHAIATDRRLADMLRWDERPDRLRFKVVTPTRALGYADRESWPQLWDALLGDLDALGRLLGPGLPAQRPGSPEPAGPRLAFRPSALGTAYRPPDMSVSRTRDPFLVDPDAIDRGTRAHQQTELLLAAALREVGLVPLSPELWDPPFDLAWQHGDVWYVVEVKSLRPSNEARQLRLGLGQVLDYRHASQGRGHEVRAILMVEREPAQPRWSELCSSLGVTLVWPGIVPSFLAALTSRDPGR